MVIDTSTPSRSKKRKSLSIENLDKRPRMSAETFGLRLIDSPLGGGPIPLNHFFASK